MVKYLTNYFRKLSIDNQSVIKDWVSTGYDWARLGMIWARLFGLVYSMDIRKYVNLVDRYLYGIAWCDPGVIWHLAFSTLCHYFLSHCMSSCHFIYGYTYFFGSNSF